MTEEIIIDGVDVKDCKRRIGKNSYCRYFKRPCAENNFNCVWKQKVRLEQENNELKKACEKCKLFDIEKTNRDLLERIDKLEQENKELKELNKIICEDCSKEIKVYWNALEEIKAIINQPCNNCKYNKDGIICCIGDCGEGKLKIIENKIEEVLDIG